MRDEEASGDPVDPERVAERVEQVGWKFPENLLVAMAVHATLGSSVGKIDIGWGARAARRIGDVDLLLEMAGVAFAFNTVNRVADARRVQLEFRFLRELRPIRRWVERRLASLTGVVYDLSYRHVSHHSVTELQGRLRALFAHLGARGVPEVFDWLGQSPVVLEGILDLIEANVMSAGVRSDLLKEAAAIAVACRALPGSGLSRAADEWLAAGSLSDAKTLLASAAPSAGASEAELVSVCRRYAWRVANAAYTITEESIRKLSALGLSDSEVLDLTLAAAAFSALAIVENIGIAVASKSAERGAFRAGLTVEG